MKFITTSNKAEQLQKDLDAALQCLSHTDQHDKETLLQANKDLQDENDILVTEIQNVIEEAQDLHRLNGALQETNKELVQERAVLLDTLNAHSHVSPAGGMTAKEVEEKIQQVRTEERSRIALMFGERRRWAESMEKLQSQKDGLEQEADRLRKILLAKQQRDRFPDADGDAWGGESAHSWLSTAKGFFNNSIEDPPTNEGLSMRHTRNKQLLRSSLPASLSGSIKQVKVKRKPPKTSRRGSIDDNGFEAVRAAAAAAEESESESSLPAPLSGSIKQVEVKRWTRTSRRGSIDDNGFEAVRAAAAAAEESESESSLPAPLSGSIKQVEVKRWTRTSRRGSVDDNGFEAVHAAAAAAEESESSLPAPLIGSIKQVEVKRWTRTSRRGSVDDNGFEAVHAATAAAEESESTSKLNKITTDTKSRITLAGETSFTSESGMPDKSIVSRSCITKDQEHENNENELTDILQDCSLANARESRRRSQNSKCSASRIYSFWHLADDEDLLDGNTDPGHDEQCFDEFCSTSTRDVNGRKRQGNLTEADMKVLGKTNRIKGRLRRDLRSSC
jgi:hypothetical protein